MYAFLQERKNTVLSRIKSLPDNNQGFYKRILEKEGSLDGVILGVCVEGKQTSNCNALWVNLVSRPGGELASIEEAIKNNRAWQCAAEGVYMRNNLTISIAKKGEESELSGGIEVKVVNSQKSPFTKQEYCSHVSGIIDYIMQLLRKNQKTRIVQRPQPAAQPPPQQTQQEALVSYYPPEELTVQTIIYYCEIYGQGQPVMVGLNNGYIAIKDRTIELEIEEDNLQGLSGGKRYTSGPYKVLKTQKGLLVSRTFQSEIKDNQMRNMVKDAAKIVDQVTKK